MRANKEKEDQDNQGLKNIMKEKKTKENQAKMRKYREISFQEGNNIKT
jgi:hypothetical protein